MKVSRQSLRWIAALSWVGMGLFLLLLGVARLHAAMGELELGALAGHGVGRILVKWFGSVAQATVVLAALGLVLGYVKARVVLGRTMRRILKKIHELPERTTIGALYGPRYLILLGAMMGIGFVLKRLGVPGEARGAVLIAVGMGLIRAGMVGVRGALDGKGSPAQSA